MHSGFYKCKNNMATKYGIIYIFWDPLFKKNCITGYSSKHLGKAHFFLAYCNQSIIDRKWDWWFSVIEPYQNVKLMKFFLYYLDLSE